MNSAYGSAATRMWTDAETLYASTRLGTADHLYGLAAECCLKAILHAVGIIPADAPSKPQKPFGVHIDRLWGEYNAALAGPHSATYAVAQLNPFNVGPWKADDRYLHDSKFSATRVSAHQNGAKQAWVMFEQAVLNGTIQ